MANSLLSITAAAAVSSPIQLIFTLLLATLVSLLTIWIVRYNRRYKGLNLPPGPPGWPIVGNLFQVNKLDIIILICISYYFWSVSGLSAYLHMYI